jgi:hypothetical protein
MKYKSSISIHCRYHYVRAYLAYLAASFRRNKHYVRTVTNIYDVTGAAKLVTNKNSLSVSQQLISSVLQMFKYVQGWGCRDFENFEVQYILVI